MAKVLDAAGATRLRCRGTILMNTTERSGTHDDGFGDTGSDDDTGPRGTRTSAAVVGTARAAGVAARRKLTPSERTEATTRAVRNLLALPELVTPGPHGIVTISIPVDDELDLTAAFDPLRDRGWRIALPVVGDGSTMTFRPVEPDDTLVHGRYGIPVPPADGRDRLNAADVDVVIAPCTAVDGSGTRVGFGAGFYDRALADPSTRPPVVVAAFDVQMVDGLLPVRDWDVGGDVVVTDRRTIRPSATAGRRVQGPAVGGCGDAHAH